MSPSPRASRRVPSAVSNLFQLLLVEGFQMVKGLLKMALGAAMLSSLGGCAMATGGNGMVEGLIYSGYKMGGVVGPGTGTKTGQACASSILGWIALGDASVAAAKAAGGITQGRT